MIPNTRIAVVRGALARGLLAGAAMVAVFSAAGCQAVAGIESRGVDPLVGGCALPTSGTAKLRFANLVPEEGGADLCVRPSGGEYARPILRGGGTDCEKKYPNGYEYAHVSAPFAAPAGKIDVKAVAAGSTCKAAALAEAKGIDAGAGTVTTVALIGNAATKKSIVAYVDATEQAASGNTKIRFAHAAPGVGPLAFGISESARVPTDLKQTLLSAPLTFGTATNGATASTVATWKFDAQGYISLPGTALNLGAAPESTPRAVLAAAMPAVEGGRTVWAIGDPTQPYFPVRGLVCREIESNGLETVCTQTDLATLSLDVFNAQLYGQFADDEAARRPYIYDALAKRESDVMCVTAVSRDDIGDAHWDKKGIIDAVKASGAFPYSVTFAATLDTQADDPKDQSGNVPPAYTVAACGGTNDATKVESAIACVTDKCTTTRGPDGTITGGSSCISTNCAVDFVPLLAGDHDQKRCFNCLVIAALSDLPMSAVRDRCTVDTRDYKHFDGQTSSIVLSKFPIRTSKTYVLPSTSYQRVVHYAELEIEKGKFLDYYCAELSAAFGDLLPYYGHYAPDPDADKWFQEQAIQARRVVSFVKANSGDKPAVIVGDWAVSKAWTSPDGKVHVDDQNPEVVDFLEKELIAAKPQKFEPQCVECAATDPVHPNPYNADKSTAQFAAYMLNMPATATTDASLFFTDPAAVPVGDKKVPLSDRWGFNVRILRPGS